MRPRAIVTLCVVLAACAGTTPSTQSAHGLPTRGMGEGEHLLFEPAPDAESLLGRRVWRGQSGAWQVADAREPGCTVAVKRQDNAYARQYESDIGHVAALNVGVADLASVQASYGDRTILRLSIHNRELIEGDLRGACGEQVITAVRVGTGARELGLRKDVAGGAQASVGSVGAGASAQRWERIGDALRWDTPHAWAFRVGGSRAASRLDVRLPAKVTSGAQHTIEIRADEPLWLIVAYQESDGRGAPLYPSALRRDVKVAPGQPLALLHEAYLPEGQAHAYATLLVYGFSAEADWQGLAPAGVLSPEAASAYVASLPQRIQAAGIPARRWTLTKTGYEIAAPPYGEDPMLRQAIDTHQLAQKTRRSCIERNELELCRLAQKSYAAAAELYRKHLTLHGERSAHAYDLKYSHADALYWSEQFDKAAIAYGQVRDWRVLHKEAADDKYLAEAARLAVEARRRAVENEATYGGLIVRSEPPAPEGTPKRIAPIALPERLKLLFEAREAYLARVDEAHDRERLRSSYAIDNATLLHHYGHWDEAKWRFAAIYEARCTGPQADASGRLAWSSLRAMAEAAGDKNEVARLSSDLAQRKCTFSPAQY